MTHPLLDAIHERTLKVAEYLEIINSLLTPLRASVEGEITDLKILPQWTFFALKDTDTGAVLRCGLHSGTYRKIGVNLEEGMAVKLQGYGKIAEKSGNFGFWVSHIEPIGEGALRRAYELLLKKLQEEGLFTRKRELPSFISHIGVISSRNGVVLQDLCRNLASLGIKIDFLHSGVEGADSAKEITNAIRYFAKAKDSPDVLVIIRGGGSLESLQGFNNEAVARAIFTCPIPVLVGIGHDVDVPIATMVADWSASTPTAVAHVINDSWSPLTIRMPRLAAVLQRRFEYALEATYNKTVIASGTMRNALMRIIDRFHAFETALQRALSTLPARLRATKENADHLIRRISSVQSTQLMRSREHVATFERLIALSSPENILARGYGLIYTPGGALVRKVDDVIEGDMLKIRLSKGTITSNVTGKEY